MDSQNPLKRSAQTDTPMSSFVLLSHLDKGMASSLARDHVKRESVRTLPIEATKATAVIEVHHKYCSDLSRPGGLVSHFIDRYAIVLINMRWTS